MDSALERISGVEVAVAAPCPLPLEINNGWLDRINVIDNLLSSRRRLYLNYAPHHTKPIAESIVEHQSGVFEAYVNPDSLEHNAFVEKVAERAKLVYVHTLHYAEFILGILHTGKVVVDIHGITPEEEEMLGRPQLRAKYEAIERVVLEQARCCVMVSRAMEKHYLAKYPDIRRDGVSLVLPIVQHDEEGQRDDGGRTASELPVRVIYSGGIQSWQNVPAMLDLAGAASDFASFKFLSQDWHEIEKLAGNHAPRDKMVFTSASKEDLVSHYSESDFGLVLRDETPVNTVACPTKLFDYMNYGIIPIVRTPSLGDFEAYGYSYVTEGDFLDGYFPDRLSRVWMRSTNQRVIAKMKSDFTLAREQLDAHLVGFLG